MPTSRRQRLPVRVQAAVWAEEVERYQSSSPARRAAERERGALDERGIELGQLAACDQEGARGTDLRGMVKAYVPIGDRPPSERPYGFVFDPDRDRDGDFYLALLAYGERHPANSRARSVYERAHRRIHGHYPPT